MDENALPKLRQAFLDALDAGWQIDFSDHAKQRMNEREIFALDVIEGLRYSVNWQIETISKWKTIYNHIDGGDLVVVAQINTRKGGSSFAPFTGSRDRYARRIGYSLSIWQFDGRVAPL